MDLYEAALVHIGATLVHKELNKREAAVDFHGSNQQSCSPRDRGLVLETT